jgi:putative hydrolase of the HAD superfamily
MTPTLDNQLQGYLAKVRVIGFDLDDTLWDNRPVIQRAVATQFDVLAQARPDLTVEQLIAAYQQQVDMLMQEDPQGFQDMTRLRQEALLATCQHLEIAEHWAEQAFARFFSARQNFKVFPEALELLSRLAKRYRLIAISNGNAEIAGTPLASYFDFHWRAGVQGAAKPNAELLIKACTHYQITPQQLAYIGDNPETDGQAAMNAGCLGILIHPDWHDYAQPNEGLFGFKSLSEFLAWLNARGLLSG